MPHPTAISLFAGAGGLCLGFEQAGFEIVLASDVWAPAEETFRLNRPHVPFIRTDIRHLDKSALLNLVRRDSVDVVIGGPPCQGFSTIGDQIVGDVRNQFFEALLRVANWVSAKCVLIENVSYIRTQFGGMYERAVLAALRNHGFSAQVTTLDAADFGVPQHRKRAFFFGTRIPAEFKWPSATHGEEKLPRCAVGDAIMDLAESQTNVPANHTALLHSETVIRRYKLIPEGGRMPPPSELPIEIRRKNFGNTYKRLDRDRPSLTLVPGNNAFPVHPTLNRSLTPREAARLQTFPDDFVFAGNRSEQCKLVGNAVPVLLAKNVAEMVVKHMRQPALPKIVPLPTNPKIVLAERPHPNPNGLTAVSFFTGAGGLALGFLNLGFKILASFDKKTVVAENLEVNFPEIPHFHEDVSILTSAQLRKRVGQQPVDVVFGGSPCQGFSIFGRRRFVNTQQHDPESDERNELSIHFIKLALSLNPRAILLENVKGITSTKRGTGTFSDEIIRRLKRAGYRTSFKVVNCAEYGVPQSRERFLLVAVADGIEFVWPEPKYHSEPESWQRPFATVGDVISDLVPAHTHDPEFSHVPMAHKPLLVERYKLVPEGGRLPEDKLSARLRKGYRTLNVRNYSHIYRRLSMDRPATTMVPGHNAFPLHPRLDRALTVREAARIQTFPDYMRFKGTRQQQCMLVGNAVPPLLATVFAQAFEKALKGAYADPGYKRDIYDLKTA